MYTNIPTTVIPLSHLQTWPCNMSTTTDIYVDLYEAFLFIIFTIEKRKHSISEPEKKKKEEKDERNEYEGFSVLNFIGIYI